MARCIDAVISIDLHQDSIDVVNNYGLRRITETVWGVTLGIGGEKTG